MSWRDCSGFDRVGRKCTASIGCGLIGCPYTPLITGISPATKKYLSIGFEMLKLSFIETQAAVKALLETMTDDQRHELFVEMQQEWCIFCGCKQPPMPCACWNDE